MGCACNKKRQATAWGSTPKKSTLSAPTGPTEAKRVSAGPVKVRFDDGEIREYSTRLEAHAAKIIAGNGELLD